MGAFNSALQSLAIFCKRQPGHILKPDRWQLIISMCQRFPATGFVKKDLVAFYEALGKCVCVPSSPIGFAEISAVQTPPELAQKLWQLCQINVETVNQLVARNKLSRVPRDPCDPCVWIDNLSALFVSMGRMVSGKIRPDQSANGEDTAAATAVARQPYLVAHYAVMEQYIWPVLAGLIDCFISDGRVLERVVRILRYSLRCFQTMTKPLLGSIAEKVGIDCLLLLFWLMGVELHCHIYPV